MKFTKQELLSKYPLLEFDTEEAFEERLKNQLEKSRQIYEKKMSKRDSRFYMIFEEGKRRLERSELISILN